MTTQTTTMWLVGDPDYKLFECGLADACVVIQDKDEAERELHRRVRRLCNFALSTNRFPLALRREIDPWLFHSLASDGSVVSEITERITVDEMQRVLADAGYSHQVRMRPIQVVLSK